MLPTWPANTALALILLGGTAGLGTFLTLGLALIGALRGTYEYQGSSCSVLADICPPGRLGVDVILLKAVLAG